MFVRIKKCSDDEFNYNYCINGIFKIYGHDTKYYYVKNESNFFNRFLIQDCEIVNISENRESSGMTCIIDDKDKLINDIFEFFSNASKSAKGFLKDFLRQKGYIKQSREDGIKEELNNLRNKYEKDYKNKFDSYENLIIILSNIKNKQNELLEIYEEQIKELKK